MITAGICSETNFAIRPFDFQKGQPECQGQTLVIISAHGHNKDKRAITRFYLMPTQTCFRMLLCNLTLF